MEQVAGVRELFYKEEHGQGSNDSAGDTAQGKPKSMVTHLDPLFEQSLTGREKVYEILISYTTTTQRTQQQDKLTGGNLIIKVELLFLARQYLNIDKIYCESFCSSQQSLGSNDTLLF